MTRSDRRAFTLVEMLIVISIIALILTIAVASWKTMTGGRSIDAGANNLSALVGRARGEALGLQRTCGLLFYFDQYNDRVAAILVREVPPPPDNNAPPGVIYIDIAPDGEYTLLPTGVGVNTFDSAAIDQTTNTGTPPDPFRADDGLIGFNPIYIGPDFSSNQLRSNNVTSRVGGAILFDGAGRLAVRPYRILLRRNGAPTEAVKVLSYNRSYDPGGAATMGKTCTTTTAETVSSPGFLLFDLPTFRDTTSIVRKNGSLETFGGTTETDAATPSTAISADEKREEYWLDQNGTPFIVSRYSGAILRNR